MSKLANDPAKSTIGVIGFDGWLIFPTIIMLISPFKITYDFYQSFLPILKPDLWLALTNSQSTTYNPSLALLLSWEIVFNVIWLALTIWLAFLFFTKRRELPRMYISWLGLSCVLQMTDIFLGSFVPSVAEQQDGGAYTELAKSAISAAIWIPYFLKSKRVKNTFINDKPVKLRGPKWS